VVRGACGLYLPLQPKQCSACPDEAMAIGFGLCGHAGAILARGGGK
jgi:hypothetical protein